MTAPIGALLLIGLGVLFLLENLGVPVFSSLGRFWPILLILVGVLMLQKRLRGNGTPPPPKDGSGGFPGPQGL
ncbi:MAG: hypothetical protein HY508_03890 [Acidobacteria bacterium]|nr:hypothetical protein [Acidobacteriota bacterium]